MLGVVYEQNAYNLPISISLTSIAPGARSSGSTCGAPICAIADVTSFCQPPNALLSQDNACLNTDGPGTTSTAGTEAFKASCPDAYSYSKDDASSLYACKSGSVYQVTFCAN